MKVGHKMSKLPTPTIFIAREHTAADTRYWYSNSVRPSVRDTLVLYENGLTYCHNFSPYGSPTIPVLPASNIFTKFRRDHPLQRR